MTEAQRRLLMKDLCGRLPYGVKLAHLSTNDTSTLEFMGLNCIDGDIHDLIENFKPYLFPLSSMTEEQEEELDVLLGVSTGFHIYDNCFIDKDGYSKVSTISTLKAIDWLNKNHFDYRGLIEKSLALDATNLGIY